MLKASEMPPGYREIVLRVSGSAEGLRNASGPQGVGAKGLSEC